jgi:hypothetical protein
MLIFVVNLGVSAEKVVLKSISYERARMALYVC